MKPIPDERACDWARDRLPLLADRDGDGLARGEDDRPTPSRDERLAVAAHLEGCAACRSHRESLARALDALWAAAGESPVEPHEASIWPALQARIAAREAEPRPRRARSTTAASSANRNRGPLERAASRIAEVRDDLPLRTAWLRDAAREEAPARLRAWFDADRAAIACDRLLRPMASPVGALAAAALLAILVGLPLVARLRDHSEARILAAAAPAPVVVVEVPLVVTPSLVDAIRPLPPIDPGPTDLAVVDEQSLAQNTDPPLRDPEGLGLDASPTTPAAVRYDFDLERGVPMPPDSRIDKPAY